jgi:glutamyl-tRNA synthetase
VYSDITSAQFQLEEPHVQFKEPHAGRFAPSPTGDFHLGNLRTAILAWAFARHAGLDFLIRMEDLDERSRPQYVTRQLHDLEEIGITWDGPVIYQSRRMPIYAEIFTDMMRQGLLYECYCTRKELAAVTSAPHRPPGSYPGTCRDLTDRERDAGRAKLASMDRGPAMRLRTDGHDLTVVDELAGPYTGAVDDLVIRRGDGVYSYNFVSVVDDALQGIAQVVRGDDLLPSTPRQVYLQRLLAAPTPKYIHVPLALNTRTVRLAKRDGAVTLRALRECGWSSGDVVELIGQSLGILGARRAGDIETHLEAAKLACGPWIVDTALLEKGPRTILRESE